jgi:hypothetical protein
MPEYDTPVITADTAFSPTGQDTSVKMDHPLRALCTAWLEKIKLASEFKRKKFQEDADEAIKI